MERDFMRLNLKEPSVVVVKEEVNLDGFKEIGFAKGSEILWSFGSKVSAVPHLMSFKVSQDDKAKKTVSNSVMPPGFMSISTTDSHDPCQKRTGTEIQPFNHSEQGGTHFSLTTTCPMQNAKMFPVSKHASPVSAGHPFFKNYYSTPSQRPQSLGGIPFAAPQPILPTAGSVVGTTDSCAKPSASTARLTIFYAGSVNVFDGVTPEKAQAIMLLAGNGAAQPRTQVQTASSKPVAIDISPINQHTITPPCSRLSSPISAGALSGSGSTSTEETVVAKANGLAPTIGRMVPPKVVNVIGSASANSMMPSVPQARKASLARFLEKRRERATNTAPYNMGMKSQDLVKPVPKEINFSITSS